jgi:hypothetical protein
MKSNNNIQKNSINNNNNIISNNAQNIKKNNSISSSKTNNNSNSSNSNINSSRTKESLIALERSAAELRSYIDVIGPCETINSSKIIQYLTFRPKNLPQKSKKEEEYHRKLVEENRKLYLEKIKEKQEKEKKYKEKLLERKNKQKILNKIWQENLIPNWYKIKKSPETKKYFYEGLPDNIRGKIWILCLGNKFSITKEYYDIEVKKSLEIIKEINIKKKDENFNKKLLTKSEIEKFDKENSINIIELDIERTFPYLNIFKGDSPLAEDLREILRVFVASRPDIGYVQGLSFIAALLLLNMDKLKAYISLMNLILNPVLLPFYKFNEYGIKNRLNLFRQSFYYNLPELCEHFDKLGLIPENYFLNWIMTIFTHSLNIDLVCRIWDVYMIEGLKTIYSTAIVILSHFESDFLMYDFSEIMNCLNDLKNLNFDEDMIVNAMKKVKYPNWILLEIEKIQEENIPI